MSTQGTYWKVPEALHSQSKAIRTLFEEAFHISRVTFFFEESSEKREARSRFPLHNLS